ncbi:MAG: LysM peptidoglycan-binding domain-containing protein [Pseudomonadota bacterium]
MSTTGKPANTSSRLTTARLALTASAFAFLGACATSGGSVYSDARYAPGDRLYRKNNVEALYPRNISPSQSKRLELASFQGIEGARLAHRLYPGERAEALDGACEPRVTAAPSESLYDIADLCDVSVLTLADFNPGVQSPSRLPTGAEIYVPHVNPTRGLDIMELDGGVARVGYGVDSLPLSPLYLGGGVSLGDGAHVISAGDTLTALAVKYDVSVQSLVAANPSLDWVRMPVGEEVRLPASANAGAKTANAVSSAESDSLDTEDYAPGYIRARDVYGDGPVTPAIAPSVAKTRVFSPSSALDLSTDSVRPRGSVTISADGFPKNALVSIYRGPNRSDMRFVGDVQTDGSGSLRTSVSVGSGNAGGVIFLAALDGVKVYSPRVAIETIKPE